MTEGTKSENRGPKPARRETVVSELPFWQRALLEMQEVAPERLKSTFDLPIPPADLEIESAKRSGEKSERIGASGKIIASRTNYHRTEPAYSIVALTLKPLVLTEVTPQRSLVVTMPNPDAPQGDIVYKIFRGNNSSGAEFRPGVDAEFEELKREFLNAVGDAAETIKDQ